MKKTLLIFVFGGLINLSNVLQNQLVSQSLDLPINLKRTVRGIDYALSVSQLEFHPTGSKMNLLLSVAAPYVGDSSRCLNFLATDVGWSEQGGFATENVRLALQEDFRMPLGQQMEIVLKKAVSTSGTFAEIDCHGLKFLSLDASLVFDTSLVVPVDCDTTPCKKLSVDFSMNIEAWSDLIVNLNLPAFRLPMLKSWVFQAEQVVFDFSENRKSSMVELPKSYIQTYFPGNENLWRGVFISSLKVTLPESFEGREPFSFRAQSLILDEMGITGTLIAKQVIPKGLAHIGGWGLNMDTLHLEFLTNHLKSGYFAGSLQLPITDTSLTYVGQIFENDRYLMQVNLNSNIQFDCWKTASVQLNKASFIKMELVEKRFLAQAVLHGEMSLNNGNTLNVPSIEFENLTLQNRKPYLTVGKFSYDGTIGISGFPAQIDRLTPQFGNDSLTLQCEASVGLSNANDGAYKGKTGFSIHSRLEKSETQQRWVYDGFSLDNVFIDIDESAFSLKGGLSAFEKDSLYGQGFSGSVELKIKQPNITVATAATFGKTNDFRYWFADGLVDFGKTGVPIFAGLTLNGFGGGAYQRMKPIFGKSKDSTHSVGVSSSGIKYVPDASTKLGIQASVTISAQSNPKAFNGQASLELSFNPSGGLNYIQFKGAVKAAQALPSDYFATMKKTIELLGAMDSAAQEQMRKEAAKDAAITARLDLKYDFNNAVFRGLFDAEISAPLLKGNGQAELYLSASKWYFHVGHPDKRFNVSLGVGSILVNTGVYLMVGHDIPAMPKPPKEIENFINAADFSSLEQDRSNDLFSINSGKGFAFGSNLAMNTGNLTFLMFSAQFQAQLGFDFMLKDFGTTSCVNRTGPLGIDGWYGSGQAYAYLAGRLGIDVKMFGKNRHYTILEAQAGTLLQAQFPNPVWLSGNLAVKYNILSGLIKGDCNFKFELGEKCALPAHTPLEEFSMITDLKPNETEADVSVLAASQAAFRLPVKEFKASETQTYNIELESFTLKSGNTLLPGDLEWNDDRTSLMLTPHDVLPPQTSLTASATLRFSEKINGIWKPLLNGNNQPLKETLSHTFKTGERPKTLPISEILYCYPVIDQRNFYVQEASEGYIQLKRDLSFLFDVANYDYSICFEAPNGAVSSANLTYNAAKKCIEWTMPRLNVQTDYTVKIIGVSRKTGENFTNISESYANQRLDGGESSVELRETKISQTATASQTVEIFSYAFRTSAYSTFAAAVNSLTLQKAMLQTLMILRNGDYVPLPDATYLFTSCQKAANFDDAELFGTPYTKGIPLVRAEAVLDAQNIYFSNDIYPLIYQPYNYSGLVNLYRTEGQSLLPTWAMGVLRLSAGSNTFPWTYDLPLTYKNDLYEVQVQLAEQHAQGQNISNYSSILTKILPLPVFGTYPITLQYRLPCGKLGTVANLSFNYIK